MTDYSRAQNFTVKDSLSTGNPEKAILGADIDQELNLVVTAVASKLDSAGGSMSGQLNMADNVINRPKLEDYSESVNAIGSIGGGTQDIDLESGNVVTGTVDTSETTFTFSNPPGSGSGSFTLILTNGGSQTINWPASVDWAGGTAPSLTASGVDVLVFFTTDAGTTWFGFVSGQDMS